ncbi:MAG TPA: hypothetical protein VNS58_26945 [Puia sp.]|nr:hypothetical protein [Puia sp.]
MLSIPLYDTFLQRQYKDAARETKKIRIAIRFDFQFVTRFFVRKAVKKINIFLLTQVIESKGLLSDIESKKDALLGMDLSETIDSINRIIKLNISLKQILSEFSDHLHSKNYEVNSWDPILEETIDSLYSTLRILKRQNKKTRIETSSLAIESSKCSLTSLQTATYDRRTT